MTAAPAITEGFYKTRDGVLLSLFLWRKTWECCEVSGCKGGRPALTVSGNDEEEFVRRVHERYGELNPHPEP